ncbi:MULTISPECIES: hypothetical protein [Bacillus]|uniref:Uncharacterized protein n=1 Tax=Bacillus mycoides TaxID=1405 RepID=A0A3D9UUT8_BACMY|nr:MULTISPECIES: hypothetical protein [Bacillus]RBP25385.1 hypothetical protein DET63_11024 [Bacillus sp. DB-2]REF33262.1 hypothetical protein DET55_11495 [Bacillus mycoides]
MEENEKQEKHSENTTPVEEIKLIKSLEGNTDKQDNIEHENDQREINTDSLTRLFPKIFIFESPLKDILQPIQVGANIRGLFQTAQLVQNEMTKAFRQVASVKEQIKLAIPSLGVELRDTIHTIRDAFNSVGSIGETIREALKTFNFEEELKVLREQAKLAEETTLNFKTIMLKMDFPPHDDIPLSGMKRIVMLYEEKGMEYTKRFVTRYMTLFIFNNNTLKEIRDSWQCAKWLGKRMAILDNAIDGHINSYYSLTIPTILAQTEGILVDGMLKLEAVDLDEDIGYIDQKDFLRQFLLGQNSSFSFDKQIENFYIKTILARFDRGKEIKSDLSRHAILHGGDINYGTKINSLKAILVFDYIFDKLNRSYQDIEKSKEVIRQRRIRRAKRNPQGNTKGRTTQKCRFKRNNQQTKKSKE